MLLATWGSLMAPKLLLKWGGLGLQSKVNSKVPTRPCFRLDLVSDRIFFLIVIPDQTNS